MIVQEEFVSISTTPDVVERHLTDPALIKQWRSPLVLLEPIEGELMALGSKHQMRVVTFALAGAAYTVTERDKNHILMTMDGLWRGADLWRWFADGQRTVVQNRVEYDMTNSVLRPFAIGFGQFFAKFDMGLQMTRLQQLIEGRLSQRQLPAGQT
ncbi:MAG: SRPBCC family protein [Chloroflexales bacterium]|nr:SRPBCC family protein [Chloroflexales bacterium]